MIRLHLNRHHWELLLRRTRRHYWLRVGLSFTGDCEPGHGWMYEGMVRRDAIRLGPLGLYLLRMPRAERRSDR